MIWTFHHGWGFDAHLWAPLIAALGRTSMADERGYFGPPAPLRPPARPCIQVGHSLGGLRMLADPAPHVRAMIVINGFDRFTAAPDAPGVAPRRLDAMIRRCAVDPVATVTDFRHRCGSEAALPGAVTPRLGGDLATLRALDLRDRPAPAPLLVLDGADDPIVGAAQRAAGFAGQPHRICAAGGHLLPLSHTAWCAAAIEAFVAGLA